MEMTEEPLPEVQTTEEPLPEVEMKEEPLPKVEMKEEALPKVEMKEEPPHATFGYYYQYFRFFMILLLHFPFKTADIFFQWQTCHPRKGECKEEDWAGTLGADETLEEQNFGFQFRACKLWFGHVFKLEDVNKMCSKGTVPLVRGVGTRCRCNIVFTSDTFKKV